MSGVEYIEVKAEDEGQRLDRWMKKHLAHLPYGLAMKLIRQGQLRVDGKRAKPDTRLCEGQKIRIPPLDETSRRARQEDGPDEKDAAYIRDLVIHDDGDIVAIDKPSGLASQGGPGIRRHVDFYLDALKDNKDRRPRLVHRLDRETSGVLLMARKTETVRALGRMLRDREIVKLYWALCAPAPAQSEGTVSAPLVKAGGPHKDKMVVDEDEGKGAVTEFMVLSRAGNRAAHLAFRPHTGRTHQIRAHAALMGAPIIGDGKYGYDGEALEELELAGRVHLHAYRLKFAHPGGGGIIDLQAPLPRELKASWKSLGFSADTREDPFEKTGRTP